MQFDGRDYHLVLRHVPSGEYEFKVAADGSWDTNYGEGGEANGPNIRFRVDSPDAEVSGVRLSRPESLRVRV